MIHEDDVSEGMRCTVWTWSDGGDDPERIERPGTVESVEHVEGDEEIDGQTVRVARIASVVVSLEDEIIRIPSRPAYSKKWINTEVRRRVKFENDEKRGGLTWVESSSSRAWIFGDYGGWPHWIEFGAWPRPRREAPEPGNKGWRIEGRHPSVLIHEEIETYLRRGDDYVDAVPNLMQTYFPAGEYVVPISAEPALMRRWVKDVSFGIERTPAMQNIPPPRSDWLSDFANGVRAAGGSVSMSTRVPEPPEPLDASAYQAAVIVERYRPRRRSVERRLGRFFTHPPTDKEPRRWERIVEAAYTAHVYPVARVTVPPIESLSVEWGAVSTT